MRRFQALGRGVELRAESGVPGSNRLLKFIRLFFLFLPDGFQLARGLQAHRVEFLLQRLGVAGRHVLRGRFRGELLPQFRELLSRCGDLLLQQHVGGIGLFSRHFNGRQLFASGIKLCFEFGSALFEHPLAVFDGHDPQRSHAVRHDRRQLGAERIGLGFFRLPLLELVIDRSAALVGSRRRSNRP